MVCWMSGLQHLYTGCESGMGSLSLSLSLSMLLLLSEEEDLCFHNRQTSKREKTLGKGKISCQTHYMGSYIRGLKSLALPNCLSRSVHCKYMPTVVSHMH